MQELRANTEVKVRVGSFPDVGDGFTPQIDITLAGNEAELLKHNGAATVDISGRTWGAIASVRGWYDLTLTTTDTNTEGMLTVVVQDDSDCLPVHRDFMVLSEAAWDSKYIAKDDGFMDVNIKTVGRTDAQETEANNLESACSNYTVTRGLTGTAVPAVAADGIGGLPISDAGGLDLDTLLGRLTGNVALASVVGALNNAAADGAVTDADTLVQYIKQLINILIGAPGIVAFPAEAAPANGVSLAEVIRAIHVDTSTTLDTLVKDIPTTAELALRTLLAADYVVVGDTIAGVTAVSNDVGITQAGADKVWGTAARVLTAGTNLNDISAADVKTAMEADAGDLSSLMEALVNKAIWRESDGRLEMHNDAGASQGTIAAQIATDGTYTTRKRALI